jgi:hypothetical protein
MCHLTFLVYIVLQDFEVLDVFKICLCAETTPANVHEYREKLRHLQKLDYTTVQNSIPAGPFSQVKSLPLIDLYVLLNPFPGRDQEQSIVSSGDFKWNEKNYSACGT